MEKEWKKVNPQWDKVCAIMMQRIGILSFIINPYELHELEKSKFSEMVAFVADDELVIQRKEKK